MTKQEVVAIYKASNRREKEAITSMALEWLKTRRQAIVVSRQALKLWRDRAAATGRAKLDTHYLKAYEFAINKISLSQSNQHL